MKRHGIFSSFVPASAILLQTLLWISPVARAGEPAPAEDSAAYGLPTDDPADLLPETEEGERFASCNVKNKVYIQYCNKAGRGICVVRSGCTYNAKREKECQKDFDSVCGYVPDNIEFMCLTDSCTLIYQ